MIPINLSEHCYSEKGLQILEELDHSLAMSKHMVELIIAGVVALIILIANATILAQEVQTAGFLNHLSEKVNNALSKQEGLDRQLEQGIDDLYHIVQILGDESQGMQVRSPLECYA